MSREHEMSLSTLQKNEVLADQHKLLQREQDHYACLITKHKKHLISLEEKIKKMQDMIVEKKKQMGCDVYMLKRAQQQNKQIQILEDRVSQATMRYDKLLSQNQEIRSEINHLCQERVKLMSEYQRINKELKKQNSIMDDLVETSVQAYDQRSDILRRMLEVQESNRVDSVHFHAKISELKRIIHHETKLRTFMKQKSRARVPVKKEDKKKKIEDARIVQTQGGSIEMYQSVHDHIVELTGESDSSKISRKFVENEEKNFGIFNYITELNNKSAMLQEQMVKLKKDIEQFELQNFHRDEKSKIELKELQDELERKSSRVDMLESQYTQVCETLNQRKNTITSLFTQITCDSTSITKKLSGTAEVTDDNVFHFMAVLEKQVQKLLMQMVQGEDDPLPVSHKLLSTMVPAVTEPPEAASFQDAATSAVLGTGNLKPLDYGALFDLVLPHVGLAKNGKIPKPKKKPGYHFKST
ncbi:coiled-coil domain-containing protein 63-like [Trichomycterus rosablanca]|uniref:coiled-coil domain-containing protein 63-like n=1 Tax=Trichomycterus rosablanca TaxID=2290929 RepID=UPI002F35EA69